MCDKRTLKQLSHQYAKEELTMLNKTCRHKLSLVNFVKEHRLHTEEREDDAVIFWI